MKIIFAAAASDPGLVIGVDGHLPWRQLTDLERFRTMTRGKPVIMGRKTYDSLPANRKPLPNRVNIVVTRQQIDLPGCVVVHTIEDALSEAKKTGAEETVVIGGGEIYRLALPHADVIELTLVQMEKPPAPEGLTDASATNGPSMRGRQATFPVIDLQQWKEVARETHPADERNDHPYSFVRYERMKG